MRGSVPGDLHVMVGVYGGGQTGIDTYAEHLAAAAASLAARVTLIATDARAAISVRDRLPGVRVVDLGLPPPTRREARLIRLWPRHAAKRIARALRTTRLDERADIAHLNHPALAPAARHSAGRVVVAGWFYPHSRRGRALETWRHTGGRFPHSAALVLKGFSHYANDARGYKEADGVVAATQQLTRQLRAQGLRAFHLAPPARLLHGRSIPHCSIPPSAGEVKLAVCAGNLGHPRKNVLAAVSAAGFLARRDRTVRLELIGGNADALHAALASLPAQVEVSVRGLLPPAAVHEALAAADGFLLPSLFEEWGYVAVEAALQGTPVIAFPVYPFGEMLSIPFGRCSEDMSPEGLAAAVDATLRDGADRGAVARAAEARFGTETTASRLEMIWSELA
jgi:glycosyltransferase involved in cell wall biosynthesis